MLRADIQLLHGRLLIASGTTSEGHLLLLREGRRVAALDADRAALMLARASNAGIRSGALSEALHVAREARQLRRAAGGGLVDQRVESRSERADLRRPDRRRRAAASPLPRRDRSACASRSARARPDGRGSPVLCEYAAARDFAARAVDLARAEGALGALPGAGETLATAQFALGAWDAAIATAADSLRLAYDTDQRQVGEYLCVLLAEVAAGRGRPEECLARLAEAQELAAGRPPWAAHSYRAIVLGHLALARGEIDQAIRQLEPDVDPGIVQASTQFYRRPSTSPRPTFSLVALPMRPR